MMQIRKYKLVLFIIDILFICLSISVSYWLKYNWLVAQTGYSDLEPVILLPFSVLLFSMIILFKNSGLYKMHVLMDSYYQFVVFVKSILISYGMLITVLFFLKHPLLHERRIILPSVVMIFILLICYRIFTLKYTLRHALKNKIIGERVVLIGAGSRGQEIAKELLNNQYAYFTPVGFFDDNKQKGSTFNGIEVLDIISNINKYVDRYDEILITLTNISYNELQRIILICQKLHKPIHIISDLYRIITEKVEVEKFDGLRTFQVPPATESKQYHYMIFKRIMDYVIAVLLILLFLPLWIFIAVLIKKGSKGPVFYKAKVVGYKAKEFQWYKFRTMYANCDDLVHKKLVIEIAKGLRGGEKLQNDTRITKIGKWLRKYSLDEFPQLINVLKGQMSLVGPRPVLPYEYDLLDDWQKERFTVLPGMTGFWQIQGRNKVNFEDQHVLDLYYVKNRNILLDTTILFNTISVVISGRTGI